MIAHLQWSVIDSPEIVGTDWLDLAIFKLIIIVGVSCKHTVCLLFTLIIDTVYCVFLEHFSYLNISPHHWRNESWGR